MSQQTGTATAGAGLPEQFNDLEQFIGWALPTERGRNLKRRTSTYAEIKALYDTVLPRMEAIIAYLNQFPLDQMPEDAARLLNITLSLAEIAPAVEFYQQPEVIDGFPAERFIPVPIHHMTPPEGR